VENADGTSIVIGGTHGIGDDIKNHLRTATNVTDHAWVGAADEVWEYYHIYNNLIIENPVWNGSSLTFDVKVPTYQKHQFRELTLNIPGLTGGEAPTFSGATPVTGGYSASGGTGIGYTLNIGLESSINTYIDQLTAIYRDDQTNLFVKRDALQPTTSPSSRASAPPLPPSRPTPTATSRLLCPAILSAETNSTRWQPTANGPTTHRPSLQPAHPVLSATPRKTSRRYRWVTTRRRLCYWWKART